VRGIPETRGERGENGMEEQAGSKIRKACYLLPIYYHVILPTPPE
jgi:hypothetical protein